MLKVFLALAIGLGTTTAMAADTCKTLAIDKNKKPLAGAAFAAYMKKCQTDATTTCAKKAAEKKLFGASATSFTKKCYSDAVGTS